jgi:glycosyltransferase involved in cell wall biosynthesis
MSAFLLDWRPALVNREGIGRATREWVRALAARRDRPALVLFGANLARRPLAIAETGVDRRTSGVRIAAPRIPHRAFALALRATRLGIDDVFGPAALVHHFQPAHLPVRRAVQTATVYDALWNDPAAPWIRAEDARRMERRIRDLARVSARLHCPSGYAREAVATALGYPRERIDLVPLGADHLVAQRGGDAPREPFLFTAARIDARKNHLAVLRALEVLAGRRVFVPWVVAGPPGHGAEPFLAALERSAVRERVRLVGALDEPSLAAHYRAARAFVFPSLGEGFGLPPLEAMSFGVPTIASGEGSLAEVLADGAFRVEPHDVDALADAIERVWVDPEHHRAASARASSRAALFTWERAGEALLAAWRRALE